MSLHIQCETADATLLLAVDCEDRLLRFPVDKSPWPGLNLKVDTLLGINSQLKDRAALELGPWAGAKCEIWQEYSAVLRRDSLLTTLYVAIVRPSKEELASTPWSTWETLPALIRTLPKDRNRLAYLKAWQILSGALEETTKALDVNEVAKYLKSLEKN